MISERIKQSIKKAVDQLDLPTINIELEHPTDESHGDFSANIAMIAYAKVKDEYSSPRELADVIVTKLQAYKDLQKHISKVGVAGPGFINFWLKDDWLIQNLNSVNQERESYGASSEGEGKTVVIDYSSPNIAKRFSIGHLRSTIIGQSLYNIYSFLGWRAIGDNHLGDWGTQFGKMIVAVNLWADKPVDELTIDEMEELYVKFHKEAERDEMLNEKARQTFKKLEDGNNKERALWKKLVEQSIKEYQKIYEILNVSIDQAYGESYYEEIMKDVIADATNKGLSKKSEGALVIPISDETLPPAMLVKNDGATTYLTRDLATILFRKKEWNPNLAIYEVGMEQTVHFKQVFHAAELLGYAKQKDLVHVAHGHIRLSTGKMSTRKGTTIKLEDVFEEANKRASQLNKDTDIAKIVAIGAIKYNDLRRSPRATYVFNWDEALNLDGNSGPYLQYTYARAKSVLRKSQGTNIKKQTNYKLQITNYKFNEEEMQIVRTLYKFPEVILEAGEAFSPNLICNYLFDLAQKYNLFYQKVPILKAANQEKEVRLALTQATAQIIHNGLHLLGIKTLEKM